MSNSSTYFLALFLIFLASSIASNARPIDVFRKEPAKDFEFSTQNDVKSSVARVSSIPAEPAPPTLSEAAENGCSLSEKKVHGDKQTIRDEKSSVTRISSIPSESATPNESEAAENSSSLTEEKMHEDKQTIRDKKSSVARVYSIPAEPAPPNESEAAENGGSLKEEKMHEDKQTIKDEKSMTKFHPKSEGPEASPAVQIKSLATVSWKLPQKKRGEKQPGFNLDYAPPKTHPPSHN